MGGGDNDGGIAGFTEILRVIHHGIGHTVDERREGIVQKADGFVVHKAPPGGIWLIRTVERVNCCLGNELTINN